MLKKITLAALLATSATAAVVGASDAAKANDHHLYSYETEYGYIQFYNYDNHWPVTRRVRFDGYWYNCTFWSSRYSCERERRRGNNGGYNGGHNNGHNGGGYNY